MDEFKLVRLLRTPSSEIYLIWDEEDRVGQVDLHYAQEIVHATIILEEHLTPEEVDELISQIDEDVVSSYLPDFEREDFLVTVFMGEEVVSYSDAEDEKEIEGLDFDEEDFDEDLDD